MLNETEASWALQDHAALPVCAREAGCFPSEADFHLLLSRSQVVSVQKTLWACEPWGADSPRTRGHVAQARPCDADGHLENCGVAAAYSGN